MTDAIIRITDDIFSFWTLGMTICIAFSDMPVLSLLLLLRNINDTH